MFLPGYHHYECTTRPPGGGGEAGGSTGYCPTRWGLYLKWALSPLSLIYAAFIFIYTLLGLFVCLSVRLYSIKVKRAEPSKLGPNFVWNLTWPQGKFIDTQNFKHLSPKFFRFLLNFENPQKQSLNLQTFLFVVVLYCTKKRYSHIELQLKLK